MQIYKFNLNLTNINNNIFNVFFKYIKKIMYQTPTAKSEQQLGGIW